MSKIELIKEAIEKAKRRESNLVFPATEVPMLGSIQVRHLLNNLGAISSNFLEVGSHRGGSFVSTVFGNENLRLAVAIDDYSESFHDGDAKSDFLENSKKYAPSGVARLQISEDCFKVKTADYFNNGIIDLYLYDGNHSYESQRKAVTYFMDAMKDEFILVVDDYSWEKVKMGTIDGVQDSNCEILFEQEIWDGIEGNNEGWWNGTYVALLKKQK